MTPRMASTVSAGALKSGNRKPRLKLLYGCVMLLARLLTYSCYVTVLVTEKLPKITALPLLASR